MPPSTWSPVLSGDSAEAARKSIQYVLDALPINAEVVGCEPELPGGSAGYAVAYAYASKSLRQSDYMDQARTFLDQAVDGIGECASWPTLHGGFVGVAWAAAHLAPLLDEQEADDAYDDIDQLLVEYLDGLGDPTNYDLVSGLVGIGLYALERWPHPNAQEIAQRVAQRIVSMAHEDSAGVRWETRPELLPPQQRALAPNGYLNLGVAHGIPGIIGYLGRLSGLGGLDASGVRTLERGVEWLLAQSSELDDGLHFPSWLPIDFDSHRKSRVAWCYGDLGLSAALWVAGECHDRRDWLDVALAIARNCAVTPEEKCGVQDHGLCHGSAGNAHIFHRMWQATQDPLMRDAARFWYEYTLATRQHETGIGGYVTWTAKNPDAERVVDREYTHIADPRLLTGSAGVALALAAGISEVDPAWDRSLLVSSLPRERNPVVG